MAAKWLEKFKENLKGTLVGEASKGIDFSTLKTTKPSSNMFGGVGASVNAAAKKALKAPTISDLINNAGNISYPSVDFSKYSKGYQMSDDVKAKLGLKTDAENAVTNFSQNYANEDLFQNAMNAVLNRENFSYDLNGDALYQQYEDNYMNQGRQAMMDMMGQAAAMTGGYGNSYAATVGNQTYQGYLQGLNDVVPQLYQMALDRYNAEGDRLATNYSLLKGDRDDEYNKKLAERDYRSSDYYNADSIERNDYYTQREYDTNQAWQEWSAKYQTEQDKIANKIALEQLKNSASSNKLAWDQWEYTKENPVVSTEDPYYAFGDYGDITEDVASLIDAYIDPDDYDKSLKNVTDFISGLSMPEELKLTLTALADAKLKIAQGTQGGILDNWIVPEY